MFNWTPRRIREVFDSHRDMTIPKLVRLTGMSVTEIRQVLMHQEAR